MKEQEALDKMIYPSMSREKNPHTNGGVIQIHVTRLCDKACFNCTQGSNLAGPYSFISLENFERAVISLKDYFGVVGVFGGNPALHPKFSELCRILRDHIPFARRGLWCNNPISVNNAIIMRETFNPLVSNINVHMDKTAERLFREGWPQAQIVGSNSDSRHAPVFVSMKDVDKLPCSNCTEGTTFYDINGVQIPEGLGCWKCDETGFVDNTEENRWELISQCDINQHWSAMVAEFRGELRAWFCEIAGAQSILHQDDPDYPDTGIPVPVVMEFNEEDEHGNVLREKVRLRTNTEWWNLPHPYFHSQVKYHCHRCGVPLKGRGTNSQESDVTGKEFVSIEHLEVYKTKRLNRHVEVVGTIDQIQPQHHKFTHYIQNANKD